MRVGDKVRVEGGTDTILTIKGIKEELEGLYNYRAYLLSNDGWYRGNDIEKVEDIGRINARINIEGLPLSIILGICDDNNINLGTAAVFADGDTAVWLVYPVWEGV